MIYTITFNPSLDYIMKTPDFKSGRVNRSVGELIMPGGKGINVSIVLKNLGIESTALGFVSGFTGDYIEKSLEKDGIGCDFIRLPGGFSRINVKLKGSEETEINGAGPEMGSEYINMLKDKLSRFEKGDIIVLAGSAPKSVSTDIYADIMKNAGGVDTVVDATGELLIKALKYRPFLIKPNNFELEEIFGTKAESEEKIAELATELRNMGARNVLVSRGADGAILATEDGRIISCKAPIGKVVNTTGSGDSTVAGFLYGYLEKGDFEYALKLGVYAGSAGAFSEYLPTKEEIMSLAQTEDLL